MVSHATLTKAMLNSQGQTQVRTCSLVQLGQGQFYWYEESYSQTICCCLPYSVAKHGGCPYFRSQTLHDLLLFNQNGSSNVNVAVAHTSPTLEYLLFSFACCRSKPPTWEHLLSDFQTGLLSSVKYLYRCFLGTFP